MNDGITTKLMLSPYRRANFGIVGNLSASPKNFPMTTDFPYRRANFGIVGNLDTPNPPGDSMSKPYRRANFGIVGNQG